MKLFWQIDTYISIRWLSLQLPIYGQSRFRTKLDDGKQGILLPTPANTSKWLDVYTTLRY